MVVQSLNQHKAHWRILGGLSIFSIGLMLSVLAKAQEITNFKFTGYEASVSTSVQSDSSNTVQPIANSTDVIKTDQKQTDVRLEATVMTHSYVYHPKFLTLDIGFGAISATNTVQTNDINIKTREPLYNYSFRGSVLPEKPLHGTFFYDSINTTPNVGSGESFNRKNNKYGFTTTLMAPLSPATVLLDVTREENKGEGSELYLDEKIDRVGISARKEISKYGSTELTLRSVKQVYGDDINSGLLLGSSQDSKLASLDTRLKLGTKTQYDIDNRIEYLTENSDRSVGSNTETKGYRFGLFARGYHSDSLTSFTSFQSNRNSQETYANSTNTSTSNAISGGATWVVAKDFDVSASVNAGKTTASQTTSIDPFKQLSNINRGFNALTRYKRQLTIGTGALDYSVRYEKFDQTSSGDPFTSVLDEQVIMQTISAPSTLSNANVTAVTEVRAVNRLTGIETVFDPVTHYETRLLGNRTTIYFKPIVFDLVPAGLGFTVGDTAKVTYTYDNGGTYGSAQLDQSATFTWTLSPQFNVFARYSDSSPKVTSGTPSIPLNQVKSLWYGLRATVPLAVRYDLVLTSNLDRENRREDSQGVLTATNSSYVRTSGDFYVRGELPTDFSNDYRAGVRRVHLVADDPTQSVDQTAYELAFGWRASSGLNLVATALLESDRDYLTERDRKSLSLRALWRYRKFYASADLARTRETQDLYARDRTVGRLTLRRDL
jgi:hypothetical protein